MIARIHATEPRSRANGPGARFVVWFQGCSLGCAGCFNPTTHDPRGGRAIAPGDLLAEIAATRDIEGLTLSGGEPFEQPAAVLELLRGARALGLSTLVFSGFTLEELRARELGDQLASAVDVLIDGRYRAAERLGSGLRGSANQRILLLSDRYRLAEVEATPAAEVRIGSDGSVVLTGVNPVKLRR